MYVCMYAYASQPAGTGDVYGGFIPQDAETFGMLQGTRVDL